jgi:ribonucleoside-diphosphate reductase alpha chain
MKRDQLDSAGMDLAPQTISLDVLREKYLKGSERSADDIFHRVATALASVEKSADQDKWARLFLQNMHDGAIGAGRIMSAAGAGIQATLINCFVQPVGDCIQGQDDQGYPGIYEALREAAETMRRGGGVGYDFSRIRPRGAEVKATASLASGPCSYINVFDQSCSTVESAGARRGAQMGVLRIDHPDVVDFITAKRTPGRWNNFNVSVAVPDSFIEAVMADQSWSLVHRARPGPELRDMGAQQRESDGLWVYHTMQARELWDIIMQSAYDFAEPGVLFIDQIRRDNNLGYCETIEATNPCGEQPLPAYGCCDLGPIILTRFVHHPFGFHGTPSFDIDAFAHAVRVQVRALDNVLDLTHWPLPQQRVEAMAKRRIGVGFTGLGNTLIMLGLRYDRPEGRAMAARISERMRDEAYAASVDLAREKGVFPAFQAAPFLEAGTFASRLPEDLKSAIRQHGIRNSHLLSIAPTGTVSLAFADNASNGIEPSFSWSYLRRKRESDGSQREYTVEDHAWRLYHQLGGKADRLPDTFVSALDMRATDHIAMMQAVQPFIDTAISKTVNVPADAPYDDFKDLYLQAWRSGLKGLATYRPNSILGSVLATKEPADQNSPGEPSPRPPGTSSGEVLVDPMRTVIDKRPKGELSAVAEKIEYWTQEGHKTLYIIVSFLPVPDPVGKGMIDRAIEFFMPVGQSGESQQWITSTMRMLSLAARGGFLERALRDMRKVAWDRGPVRLGHARKSDGTMVAMWHDSEVAAIAFAIQNILARRAEQRHQHITEAQPVTTDPDVPLPMPAMAGRKCHACGAHAVIRKDGCDFCSQCGELGSCG